jgi:high-affinity Fe2+/Pb2+ permease
VEAQYTIGGIPIALVIIGLVNEAKKAGVPSQFAGLLAILLGLVFYTVWSALAGAEPMVWFTNILTGILAGLAASGGYDNIQTLKGE